jgi:UDP-glucose 4-epimerase
VSARSVLVTGASGYVGQKLVAALAADRRGLRTIIAADVRPPREVLSGVEYVTLDVRSARLGDVLATHEVDTVVHLATIVTPPKGMSRELEYEVDVLGSDNVLRACVTEGVRRVIVTSSGAAYGYHADSPALLEESAPLRGNEEFAYAHHKRLVEEELALYREKHPALEQLIFRPGTILGAGAKNQITAIFERPVITGLRESETPFVFVLDEDVVECLLRGVHGSATGIYNLAGDGVVTLREIAARLHKPFVPLPSSALRFAIAQLQRRGLTDYGPEQVAFLAHRPVLSNERLKTVFGFTPRTSRQAFEVWCRARFGDPRRATGQSVVITGAAGGIGLATAWGFAREGARIALLDLDAAALERARSALAAEGHEVLALLCDVRDGASCSAAIDAVTAAWGGVDVLVNNAGISHRSLLADTDASVLHRVMGVNFFGAVHCTQAALPSLLARRGTVVAISSVAGFSPLVGRTGYAASKHALHGFFDSLRAEVAGRGVNVLLVCPSYVDTGIDAHALGGDGAPKDTRKVVVGKLESPANVATAIVRGVLHREKQLVLSTVGKSAWWLSRVLPSVYERVMLERQGAEFGLAPRGETAPRGR